MELEAKLKELIRRREGAHMAHVYYGDPDEEFSIKLIETLAENGADIIEFGIPFSDPIADGLTFQAACERALKAGVTPAKCLAGIERLRVKGLEAPIVVTTYFNIPYTMGFDNFLDKVKVAGVQAVLIPDLPFEEAEPFMEMAGKRKIHVILQVAPTTSKNRLNRILAKASGFIYLIGVEGVTGSRIKNRKAIFELLKNIKEKIDKPVLIGFGISRGSQAEAFIKAGADGVVVGSAYAKIYAKNLEDPFRKLSEIAELANEIKNSCMNGYRKRC